MADDSSHSGQKEPDSSEGGRLWRGLRALLFGDEGEHSLRKELEDAIDEYDEEEHGAVTGNGDLSPVERQMLKNLQIGRAHVCTPVTNAHLVCRLLLEKKYLTLSLFSPLHFVIIHLSFNFVISYVILLYLLLLSRILVFL